MLLLSLSISSHARLPVTTGRDTSSNRRGTAVMMRPVRASMASSRNTRPRDAGIRCIGGRGSSCGASSGGRRSGPCNVRTCPSRSSRADVAAGRIRLSKWLASAKHSKHNHYAFKMALGVMLLALPGYLPLGSSGTSLLMGSTCADRIPRTRLVYRVSGAVGEFYSVNAGCSQLTRVVGRDQLVSNLERVITSR